MAKAVFGVFLLQLFVLCAVSKKVNLPSYIKPCSASSPDFDQCCLEHGRDALPYILKGDKKFGIPNMVPLVIPQINVTAGKNLEIFLTEVHTYGLDKAVLEKVKIDTIAKTLSIDIKISELNLIGKYEIEGKIMFLPIRGTGDFNINAIGGEYQYNANYIVQPINGQDHFDLTEKDSLDFLLQNLQLRLDNLFDGDKKLGTHMNKFLNENWKEVLKEFGPAISETVRSVGRSIASAIFKKVPYHELVLD